MQLPDLPTDFPPLRDLVLPKYEKMALPNGLRVLLLEDHELGLVGGQLLVRGGGKAEPPNKVGLAALAGAVQRSGGSVEHSGEAMDARLEAMAARIESGASVSEMSVAFRCLREDLPDVLTLFSEVVRRPAMPEEKLRLARSQFLGSIARRNDNPGAIAGRELPKLLYGNRSPYGRIPEAPTVTAVTLADVKAFHAANFRPDGAVLGIWGDFDAAATKELVLDRFGDWAAAAPDGSHAQAAALVGSARHAPPFVEKGTSFSPPGVYIVDRPGLTQGYVRMAELGTTLDDPDLFALDVLNSILNGFGGRLFDEVRSREGLAYSVYGAWSPAVEHRGAFVAGGETRLAAVPKFVQAVRKVLLESTAEPPSQDELAKAKESALNSFVFNFVDPGSQLSRIMTYELFGVEQDFPFKYKRAVEGLTAEAVLEASRKHLHPLEQPILVVADASAVRPALAGLGLPVVDVQVD